MQLEFGKMLKEKFVRGAAILNYELTSAVDALSKKIQGLRSDFDPYYPEFDEVKLKYENFEKFLAKANEAGVELPPIDYKLSEKVRIMGFCCFNKKK